MLVLGWLRGVLQVLHVHGVCSVQKRVKATNSFGQTLSIPLDSAISVQRISSSGSGEFRLSFHSAFNYLTTRRHSYRVRTHACVLFFCNRRYTNATWWWWWWWFTHADRPGNDIIKVKLDIIFMQLSSWKSHCESPPGSSDKCRTVPSGCQHSDQANLLGL